MANRMSAFPVYFLIFLLLFVACFQNIDSVLFKMTNAHCESFNKTWVLIKQCRLRAKSRNITVLNIRADFLYPAKNIDLKLALKKKANGYKPFLYEFTIDACQFMRKNNNPFVKIILDLIKDVSTVNHTCPYEGEQIVKDFYLRKEKLRGLPFPSGEYLLLMTWIFDKKPIFVTNVYFTFTEDLINSE